MPEPGPLRIFLSTADQSGDDHAAALAAEVRRLRPGAEVAGLGGPRMAEAGCHLVADTMRRSTMWMATFREIGPVLRLLRETGRFLAAWRPQVFVPIDSPGLNFPLARRARALGIANVYYMPPQIWAWGRWRLRKLRRLFGRLLVTLPFEAAFYRARGFRADDVGHPVFDYLPGRRLEPDLRRELGLQAEETLIGLLPGSRQQEIRRHMPILRDAALLIRERCPAARFAVGASAPGVVPLIEQALQPGDLDAAVLLGRTLELMRDARLCLVASGTATLQLLHFATPMVVVYRLNWLEWLIMHLMKRSRYIALVNVLAEHQERKARRKGRGGRTDPEQPVPLVPEFAVCRDRPGQLAASALTLLEDSSLRQATVEALRRLRRRVDHPGAVRRAAEAVIAAAEGR